MFLSQLPDPRPEQFFHLISGHLPGHFYLQRPVLSYRRRHKPDLAPPVRKLPGNISVGTSVIFVNRLQGSAVGRLPRDHLDVYKRQTMNKIHQPSFEYTDSILKSWLAQNGLSLKDLEALDAAYYKEKERKKRPAAKACANKFKNFDSRSYDMNDLERKLVQQ